MKKIFIFSLMLASFLCSEAKERSLQQKLEIASEVLGERLPSVGGKTSRGGAGENLRVMRQTDAYTVVGRNRNGFVVLANDDAFKAVIGYSNEGTFGDNPALGWFLDRINDASLRAASTGYQVVPAGCKSSVEHLIAVKWGQDAPFNSQCPQVNGKNCWVGCVATAMAQIMSVYQYPSRGKGVASYNVGDEKRTAMLSMGEYKWTEMLPAYSGDNYSSEQAAAVAKLMFHCGCVAGMNYSLDGSGASLPDAAAGMKKHFGYLTQYYGYKDYPQTNNYDDAAWRKVIYRELSAGHPILYAGTSNKQGNDKTSSHAFVLDGYDADGNVGVNWGYGGLGDGYFDLSLLPLEYTDNGVSVDEEYQWYQEMVVIHCPDDGEIDYDLTSGLTPVVGVTKPCSSGVYDINGRKVSLPAKHDGIYIRGGKKYTVK